MENPPDQAATINLQSQDLEVAAVRRRFVQTTLFPLKPLETKVEESSGGGDEVVEVGGSQGGKKKRGRPKGSTTPSKRVAKKASDATVEEIEDDEAEEVCGSQGGKRRRGRPKGSTTPSKRVSKKAAVNGTDAPIIAIDDTELPNEASPQQLKAKQRVSARNGRTNGNKATSVSEVTHLVATQKSSQPVPDLWLEAKKTAEENSRIFAGKQIHPFFSSWKAGKKDMETTEVEINGCLDERMERKVELGPVHVFDDDKSDLYKLDWSNWTFYEEIFSKTNCNQERKGSCSEGIADSITFNDIPRDSNCSKTSLHLKSFSLAPLRSADEDSFVRLTCISPIEVDEVTANDPLKNIEKDFGVSRSCIVSDVSSQSEQQSAVPQERILSYYLNRGTYPENSLWTNKYHPEKALEVCGNNEGVKFINDWLHHWHATDFHFCKRSYSADKCSVKDNEYDVYDSDTDTENDEASGLKNVLLVTGPVGSGKSAAIYACAKEQGFQVIEVNASDWRNGALLKQKFGEAVGSHLLKRSQEIPTGKLNFKSSPVITSGAAELDLNNDRVDVVSLLEKKDYVGNIGSPYNSNDGLSCDKGDIKTLILFEDVDVNLCDDRGFISTIQQLADTAKRPMILTSNNESPLLPDNLDREEVFFTMPSLQELAHHMYLVCSAEKANVHPDLIERCIEFCRGDIRKTLTYLQFWCQNKECIKDGKMQSIAYPMMFNLEAGHYILPKLIPWALPSLLSEFVEAEVAKSFSGMEENYSLLGLVEEEAGSISIPNKLDFDAGEAARIKAKKEAILSGNCFLHVDNDLIAGSNTCELSNSSGSPVAFSRRNMRRKSGTMLSDSEDEICNHENHAVSDTLLGNDNDTFVLGINSHFPVLHSALEGISTEFRGPLVRPGTKVVEATSHQSEENALANHFNFLAPDNSGSQSADPFLPSAEAKHQQLEFVHGNCRSYGEAKDSLKLFNDLFVHTQDGNMEINMHQYSSVDHEKFPIVGNSGNHLEDQLFHFREANLGTGNERNLSLNPFNNHVQHCEEEKIVVKRCLFKHPVHDDPTSHTTSSPRNQSTGQLAQCIEPNKEEPRRWHLEMGIGNRESAAGDASFNPLFDQLLCCSKSNMVDSEKQHQETENINPFCYTALGDSLNPSNDQLFHFVKAKEKEVQNQHPEAGERSDNNCAAVDGPFLQLSNHSFGMSNAENIQRQCPQISDVNYAGYLQLDDSQKLLSEQLHNQEGNAEIVQHQSPDMDIVDLINSPTAGNSLNPLDGQILKFIEAKAEEQPCQYSGATNVNNLIDQCQSFNMSYVPESTFVPETEVNDGTECPSETDQMEIVSPVTMDNAEPSFLGDQASEYRYCGIDININARDEEMGDSVSENEHLEPSMSDCPVMDECSRMDFFKRSKSFRRTGLKARNYVQERWNELRQKDLGRYLISEHKNALQLMELGYKMSNLISESELLLHDYEYLLDDLSGLSEETFSYNWHDQQVQMGFSIAHYGYLLYAKDIYALRSKTGLADNLHLGWEMLVSTSNSLALGKLLTLNRSQISLADTSIKQAATTVDISFMREREIRLQNVVQSVVPLRSYLTVRGCALHDYLSSLTHILRSETSRLAEAAEKTKRRRVRVAKNYLRSGGLDLSQDDILKLNEYDIYQKDSSKSTHGTSR